MSGKINNPHDKFFKAMLSDRQIAMDFLKFFLPVDITAAFDWESLQPEKDSYVTAKLEACFSDAVFSVQLQGQAEDLRISVLLEHKSRRKDKTAFQVLSYLARAYQSQIDAGQAPGILLPIVYYHGNKPWNLREVQTYFESYPAIYQPFVPGFRIFFIDLARMDTEQLFQLQNTLLASALLVQKHSDRPDLLLAQIGRIFASFADVAHGNFIRSIFVYTLQIIDEDKEVIQQIVETLPVNMKKEIMSTYDKILLEGEKRGMAQGIEHGVEKSRKEMIIKGHEQGLSVALLANIAGMSEAKVQEVLKNAGKSES